MGTAPDVIDLLAGIAAGSRLDAIRAQRTQARENAQASYLALFHPAEPGDMAMAERFAVAAFVAGLHRAPAIAAFYASDLADAALAERVSAEAARAAAHGPYGKFPAGKLSHEDQAGPEFRVRDEAGIGPRLAAALEHAHMLVFHPRDAAPEALQKLLAARWSTTGIVTLSQLVSFLSFQIRVVEGLRALAAAGGA
jgi:CMD domain protein